MDDPATKDFADRLDEINALAESSPGFIGLLQTEDGNANAIKVFADEFVITNLSVWEPVEALGGYVYRPGHVASSAASAGGSSVRLGLHGAVVGVPAGHHPTVGEALHRLDQLKRDGALPEAFMFRKPHERPGRSAATPAVVDDRKSCCA